VMLLEEKLIWASGVEINAKIAKADSAKIK
jgi:hypothetical protein